MSAMALEFLILTAGRTSEVLRAEWAEVDLTTGIWTIPATRMKAGKEHRVPLSGQALDILKALHKTRLNGFAFPGLRRDSSLGSTTLIALIRRMGFEVTIHGFRSSFRDWAGEQTDFPRELAEASLAHSIGAVEAAYRRTDFLEKRRALMEMWGTYCNSIRG
jgi:integrase